MLPDNLSTNPDFRASSFESWSEFYEAAVKMALATRVHPDIAAAKLLNSGVEDKLGPIPTAPWYLKDRIPTHEENLIRKAQLEDELEDLQRKMSQASSTRAQLLIAEQMDDLIAEGQAIKARL